MSNRTFIDSPYVKPLCQSTQLANKETYINLPLSLPQLPAHHTSTTLNLDNSGDGIGRFHHH